MMQVFLFIALIIFFALLLGFIARGRRADTYFWALMGGLFGPFAVPFVFFSKPLERQPKASSQPQKKT